jgi:hypothetical protein
MEMLVRLARVRWRIERDCEELKQEFGLYQYIGRGWRGSYHHATLCIAPYGCLAAERARLSPPLGRWRSSTRFDYPRRTALGGLPARPERQVESSVASGRNYLPESGMAASRPPPHYHRKRGCGRGA